MVDAADAPTPAAPVRWWREFQALPSPFRFTTYAALVLVLVLVALAAAGAVLVRRPFPQTSGEIEVAGLDGTARVVRDDAGIPQIYAGTMHDLMLAQGFVHAQERFFEMDVRRHATAGRLSEMFGASALETDLVTRTLGWRRVAEKELTLLDPGTRDLLDAYAEGVNAYLDDRALSEISLEYAVLDVGGLDYTPEEWTAVDSIAWLKAMAWDLRGNLEEEIGRAISAGAVGADRADQLFPDYDAGAHPRIVEDGDGVVGSLEPAAPPSPAVEALAATDGVLDAVPALLGEGDGIGSNAWVVDGSRTESGAPILANDPHLGVSLPGVWMQVGLHCEEVTPECPLDVAGFSFSGVPGVVIGHNADIAWGFTNLAPDVTDLYVERLAEGDRWEYGGRLRPLEVRTERIEVRGEDPVELTVRSTAHGPLLSDLADGADGVAGTDVGLGDEVADAGEGLAGRDGEGGDSGVRSHGVALAWTALEPRPTIEALFALNVATDWESFRRALRTFAVPGQNVVYADVEGHIGYQATGRVPIRGRRHDGRTPVAGWLPRNDWTGDVVPYRELPSVLDPPSGAIVTANQAVADPTEYPYFLTADSDYGYRSTRIGALLDADDSLTVEEMGEIQLDDHNAIAPVLVPFLLDVAPGPGYYGSGQRLLEDWDFHDDPDSAAAAYFEVVWSELLERTFADELPAAVEPEGGDRWFAVVESLLTSPQDPWWDDVDTDGEVEGRDDILVAALRAARDELTKRQSPNASEWSWGELHRLELRSSTLGESGIAPIEWLFNRGPWDVGGGSSVVNATGWNARQGFEVATAPSMRMVVPMDDLDDARWVSLTGVSGHAFHDHYTDQTDVWARGETLTWAFSAESVEAAGEDELTLRPPDEEE